VYSDLWAQLFAVSHKASRATWSKPSRGLGAINIDLENLHMADKDILSAAWRNGLTIVLFDPK
jgi:hypothetical protein